MAVCCDGPIPTGNPAVLSAVFSPPHEDDDVTGTTSTVVIVKPDRTTESITSTPTVIGNTVLVEATWDIPTGAMPGVYWFRVTLADGMKGRRDIRFEVSS